MVYRWRNGDWEFTAPRTIDTTDALPEHTRSKVMFQRATSLERMPTAPRPYMVKMFDPPTVSCVANPSAVISGSPSTITTTGISPQNRPLTYNYPRLPAQ